MSCGVGHRHGSDLVFLWLWYRPVATAPIGPLACEPPYAVGVALKDKKKKKSHTKKQTCGCQGGGRGTGRDWEFVVNRLKLLYLEWISSELLLYSTGNYIQLLFFLFWSFVFLGPHLQYMEVPRLGSNRSCY